MLTVTLFIPSLFPPASGGVVEAPGRKFPALERLLGRSRAATSEYEDQTAWLCDRFAVRRQLDWPVAPVTLSCEAVDPGRSFWLRADPVHLRAQHDQLLLLPPASLAIESGESQALVESLNRHFSPDGLTFLAPHPQRWYLRTPVTPDIRTVSLESVIGRDINRLLPQGEDRMRFHRLFNEVQMLLHAHPVNAAREESGAPLINSLWFWGGGTLPAARASWALVISDNPLASGLARLAEVPATGIAPGLTLPSSGDVLVMFPDNRDEIKVAWADCMSALEREWFAPLLEKLRSGEIRQIDIATMDGGHAWQWTASRRDLWKFWKPGIPLADLAAGSAHQ